MSEQTPDPIVRSDGPDDAEAARDTRRDGVVTVPQASRTRPNEVV